MTSGLFKRLTSSKLVFILLLTSTIGSSVHGGLAATKAAKPAFLQTPGTVLEIAATQEKSTKVVKLKRGEIVTHGHQRLVIEAPNATVTVCPGAIVVIDASDKLTRVLACWENSNKCVTVVTAGATRTVRLGGELSTVVETDTDEAEKILANTNLRRRRVQYARPKDGLIVVNSQFSLLDIGMKDPILHSLNGQDTSESRSILGAVNKAAAALSIASSKEPYSLIDQP